MSASADKRKERQSITVTQDLVHGSVPSVDKDDANFLIWNTQFLDYAPHGYNRVVFPDYLLESVDPEVGKEFDCNLHSLILAGFVNYWKLTLNYP